MYRYSFALQISLKQISHVKSAFSKVIITISPVNRLIVHVIHLMWITPHVKCDYQTWVASLTYEWKCPLWNLQFCIKMCILSYGIYVFLFLKKNKKRGFELPNSETYECLCVIIQHQLFLSAGQKALRKLLLPQGIFFNSAELQ